MPTPRMPEKPTTPNFKHNTEQWVNGCFRAIIDKALELGACDDNSPYATRRNAICYSPKLRELLFLTSIGAGWTAGMCSMRVLPSEQITSTDVPAGAFDLRNLIYERDPCIVSWGIIDGRIMMYSPDIFTDEPAPESHAGRLLNTLESRLDIVEFAAVFPRN